MSTTSMAILSNPLVATYSVYAHNASYIDNLLAKLSNCGAGCYIGSVFEGALAYVDDIVLLAASPSALHKMLHMCELYASAYDIKFNVDKSKCMIVPPRGRRSFF